MIQKIEKEFSGDFKILHLLSCEERWCTLYELQTVYNLKDFYDMLEMAAVNAALRENARRKQE